MLVRMQFSSRLIREYSFKAESKHISRSDKKGKVCLSGTESNRILTKYEKEIKGRIEGKE